MELDPVLAQEIIKHIDALAVCDTEGRYIYVNRGWVEWMGICPEDVMGKYVRDVVKDTKIDIVLRTKQPVVGEILLASKDKPNIKEASIVNYYPIFREGKFVAAIGFIIVKSTNLALSLKQRLMHLDEEVKLLKGELHKLQGSRYNIDNIIGDSTPMKKMKKQIFQAARSNSTVLINGETGTGKELVAHAIHNASQRNACSFIKINCAAIPADLLESELFGYEGGAFTGAVKSGRQGKFEMANKGSLFLDEINQLPMVLQPKLLRVLQEREVDRIGGRASLEIDVRVIAATNVALDKLVEEQKFRSDLFYRLNVMLITVPPLRERKEDLPQLVSELLNRLNLQLGVDIKGVSPDVLELLLKDEWPGNVRELHNVLERAMNIAWRGTLELEHFEWFIENRRKTVSTIANGYYGNNSLKEIKRSSEKAALDEALRSCGNNKTHAARKLKISRTMIYKKIRQLKVNCK
jgi:transcriptional regulator with PAS, ATPase and Fis domain